MIFLTIYRWSPADRKAIIARFMENGGVPPSGVKLLSRWSDVAGGRGFTLTEFDDPVALSAFTYAWSVTKVHNGVTTTNYASGSGTNIGFTPNDDGSYVVTGGLGGLGDILKKLGLVGKDLNQYSLETVQMFYQDASASGFKL